MGNELLLGMVQDTNSNYLCRVVRGMGGRVSRIAMLPDDLNAIVAELASAMDRRAQLIFTCGGLGPTDDDMTLSAIAEATQRPLELDDEARDFVALRYRELADAAFVASAELTESRLKMARLPRGSRMLNNPVGAAPAVALETDRALIVALPGVPRELKSIVEGPLQTLLVEKLGGGSYREIELIADCGDESVLAPILRVCAAAHPSAYIKSRARGFGPEVKFLITISAHGRDWEQVALQVDQTAEGLVSALSSAGIHAAIQ